MNQENTMKKTSGNRGASALALAALLAGMFAADPRYWSSALSLMTTPCVEPLPLYRGYQSGAMVGHPQVSDLCRPLDQRFKTIQRTCDQQFQPKHDFWQPVIDLFHPDDEVAILHRVRSAWMTDDSLWTEGED